MNNNRIYSYINNENYDYLMETKSLLKNDGIDKISNSKLIQLAIIELKENTEYPEIKKLLKEKKLIQ